MHAKGLATAAAYADDLNTLSSSIPNQRKQNIKIAQYSNWVGLRIRADKCEWTYADWSASNRNGKPKAYANTHMDIHTHEGLKQIPFKHPNEPVKYLGA